MGPSDSPPLSLDKLLTIGDNDAIIRQITSVLGMDDLGSFTASGKDIANTATSKATLGSTSGKYLGKAEGKTPAALTKEVMRARNENAILSALEELGRPTSDFVRPVPPELPSTPKTPGVDLPGIMRAFGPVANFLSLMLHSGDLNDGEASWLKQRDTLENANKPKPNEKFRPLT